MIFQGRVHTDEHKKCAITNIERGYAIEIKIDTINGLS